VPTLLLRGTESPWPTQRICDLLEQTLPDARLENVKGAGHMAPLTHRDLVNAMIVAHLDSNSGQASRRPSFASDSSAASAARA
jgi:pimeloyl-ACP methyl ester carboxylesterase